MATILDHVAAAVSLAQPISGERDFHLFMDMTVDIVLLIEDDMCRILPRLCALLEVLQTDYDMMPFGLTYTVHRINAVVDRVATKTATYAKDSPTAAIATHALLPI